MGDLTIFSKRLKEARQKAELTQAELAEKAGTTAATISSYESIGSIKKASLDLVINFAKALNVSLDWLCGLDKQDINKNNITAFSAREYLYSIVKVLTEMSNELQEIETNKVKTMNIVITQTTLIRFINKINDLLKVYRAGTLSEDLYKTCVDKIVNDFSSHSCFCYDNFLNDYEALEAEQQINQTLWEVYESEGLRKGDVTLKIEFVHPYSRGTTVQLHIPERKICELIENWDKYQQLEAEKNPLDTDIGEKK